MQKPDRSSYTAIDFIAWRESSQLEISPRFQRRAVWTRAAKSFLIDTIILGFPIPPVYIRVIKKNGFSSPVREVIDGQQRISAVLEYIAGDFALSKNIESPYTGLYYHQLPGNVRDDIEQYSFIAEVFYGLDDPDVLSIFARLNMNSVRLNAQELRNGKFFGPFKQSAYSLALSHLTFWRNNRIFSETSIARMQEVELTSELMIALLAGMQDKKKSIDDFYRKNDDEYAERVRIEDSFRNTIDEISESLNGILSETAFRRTPLFYSMFLAMAHRIHGVPRVTVARTATGRISRAEREKFRDAIVDLSNAVNEAKDEQSVPDNLLPFVSASLTQTDNIRPRVTRFEAIYNRAF